MACYIKNKAYRLVNLPNKASLGFTITVISTALLMSKSMAATVPAAPNDNASISAVEFNPAFVHGAGIDVSRYSQDNPVSPGDYDVMVIVNNQRIGRKNIRFKAVDGQSSAEPCFSLEQFDELGLRFEMNGSTEISDKAIKAAKGKCYFIRDVIKDGSTRYNSGDLELSVNVPQINLVHHPRGYISPSLWDAGGPAGFLDYNGNIYSTFNGQRGSDGFSADDSYNGNLGLISGLNVGEWRFRKRFNTNWSNTTGRSTQNLYGYAATDITSLKSQLTLGDSDTNGNLFDSYGLRGAQLASDNRMLAEGIRNYSPQVQGVAETNARVTVTQRGNIVYETVVPPGAFELTDIGTMAYGGDLEMTITEADGRTRTQRIPFSAPPLLLYKGVSQFDFAVGQLNDNTVSANPAIVQGSYHYGLGNTYTLYGGTQLAEKYSSVGIGNAFNTPIGGISMDVTHARSVLADDVRSTGNSFKVNYTKYVGETDTNLTLAAYRYSSSGFYSFREASLERYGTNNGLDNYDYRTRNRLSVSVSQRVASNMSVNLNTSLYTYWGQQDTSKQYALSFNHTLRYFSYALTAQRTMRSSSDNDNHQRQNENSYLLAVSVPLGGTNTKPPVFSSIYSMVSHDDSGNTSLQTSANGSRGEQGEVNYGVGAAYNSNRNDDASALKSVSGNVSYRTPVGQFGATASANNTASKQLSLSANGSVVGHANGLTLGPRLGDAPFAVIHAEGAKGAKIFNGSGATIDGYGNAIMPSMTPYRENSVAIDYKDLPSSVDVLENQKTVVPRAGAMIPVNMKTVVGAPLILIVRDATGEFLPIGTDLLDEKGASQAIVGQGGMAFIRGWDPLTQALYANIGGAKGKCRIQAKGKTLDKPNSDSAQIQQLEVTCLPG